MPTSYQTDAILFVKTSRELDYNPKMIMTQNAGHLSSDFVTQVGKDLAAREVLYPIPTWKDRK